MAVLLMVVFAATLPGFGSLDNAMTLLRNVSVLGVLALGMTLVVLGRGVDLSQVAVALVAAGIMVALVAQGMSLGVGLAVGLAAAVGMGLVNGVLVAGAGIPPLFATLASALVFLGVARLTLLPSLTIGLPPAGTGLMAFGRNYLGIPGPLMVFAASALALHLFLSLTVPGRFIRAQGDNPDAAWLSGLPVTALTLLRYALCAAMAYLGALVMVASTATVDLALVHSPLVFDVLAVVILGGVSLSGGRGSVVGVVCAVVLVGVLMNGMTLMDLDSRLQDIARGVVLLAAILLDSRLRPGEDDAGD